MIAAAVLGVVFVLLWPRRLSQRISHGELRCLHVFLLVRIFTPFAFEYIGSNADSFFTGGWDSARYEGVGARVAEQLGFNGYSTVHAEVPGTGAVELAVGYLFYFSGGANRLASVLLWSWLGAIGLVLFWWYTRPFILQRREWYAAVVLLAPTTLFWNSSLGKEAPLTLGIGCLVAGLSVVINGGSLPRTAGFVVFGVLLTGYVRPHITLMFFLAVLTAALLARSVGANMANRRRSTRFIIAGVALVGASVAVPLSSDLLGVEDGGSLVDAAYGFADQESIGRSAFEARAPRSAFEVPGAVVTTLFRPFPWESRTFFQLLASFEAAVLALMLMSGMGRIIASRSRIELNLMVLTAIVYVAIFSSAIVGSGNFGIIVRQKMQVWSFVIFIIFAITPVVVAKRRHIEKPLLNPSDRFFVCHLSSCQCEWCRSNHCSSIRIAQSG